MLDFSTQKSQVMQINTRSKLVLLHIVIICISNILVQYPFSLLGYKTTWGAFSYPLIFILTDLTTRLLGGNTARQVVFRAMLPGLMLSVLISQLAHQPTTVSLRIAVAGLIAYLLGQLLDISIFQKIKGSSRWWVAPSTSSILGNIFDTYCFFFIAFFNCSNPFLSAHWPEIATVDLCFKLLINVCSFVPLYGFLLKTLPNKEQFKQQLVNNSTL